VFFEQMLARSKYFQRRDEECDLGLYLPLFLISETHFKKQFYLYILCHLGGKKKEEKIEIYVHKINLYFCY